MKKIVVECVCNFESVIVVPASVIECAKCGRIIVADVKEEDDGETS